MARSLSAAYAGGLLSEKTFVTRLDYLLRSRVVDSFLLLGDLSFRRPGRPSAVSIKPLLASAMSPRRQSERSPLVLALDWSGETAELLVGRHPGCDVVLSDGTVSRRHARLLFRDGRWIVQDLNSTNGTTVNGRYVGRCELCPGDQLLIGDESLAID